MSTKRKSAGSQRKLNFQAHTVDDDVAVDEEHTQQQAVVNAFGKRSLSSQPSASAKRPRATESYLSPKKKGKASAVVTPATDSRKKPPNVLEVAEEEFIPTYIHKNVEYIRKGHAEKLSPRKRTIVQWIHEKYEIPNDIEHNRNYGPLSGSSYEDRVIAAYRLGKLDAVGGDETIDTVICTTCAELGHERDQCPTLL